MQFPTIYTSKKLAWTVRLLVSLSLGVSLFGCSGGSVLSTKDEVRMGKQAAGEIERSVMIDAKSSDAERVTRIGERLIPHCDPRPGVPYTFKVIDANIVNAASLPGGPVYVYKGIIDLIGDDDDALACIIGHEIGHVNGRHVARQITKQLQAGILLSVILRGGGNAVNQAANVGMEVLSFKYGRDDEYDADRRGVSYAYKAGFDGNGMIRAFQKLQSMDKKTGNAPEWMQNHPLTAARIDRIKKIIDTQDYRYGK